MRDRSNETVPAPSYRRFTQLFVAISASLALVIAAGGAFGFVTYKRAEKTGTTPCFYGGNECATPSGDPNIDQAVGPCVRDVCNYLLLGSDSRAGLTAAEQGAFGNNQQAGAGLNSDVIMLVHTDPKLQKAIILSFPRDLWVEIPGDGSGKINSSFGIGGGIADNGPQMVARTVSAITGLKINHYLYVDLKGFEGVVDTLDGVDMCIAAENVNTPGFVDTESADGSIDQIYYAEPGHIVDPRTGLDVVPGCQHLDASQALAYVRTRHLRCDAAAPDFYRIGRQQQFFRAVLNRLMQPQELIQAPRLIGPILRSMRRDEELDPAELAYLVGRLRGVSTGAVEFRSVPASPFTTPDGLEALSMDPSAQEIFKAIRNGRPLDDLGITPVYTPPSPANITLPVVDHSSGGNVVEAERVASESGFIVPAGGAITYHEYGANVSGDAIAYAPGHSVDAQVVQQYFPGLRLKEIEGLPDHVALFITSSYHPLSSTGAIPPDCVRPSG